MSEKLRKLEVNLQQSIIWTGEENVCNTICAITHKHRDLVVIGVVYRDIEDQILAICGIENPKVFYDDSFRIDTWENRIEKYLADAYQDEERHRTIIERTKIAENLLVAALEGGSNYWIERFKFVDVDSECVRKYPSALEAWRNDAVKLVITEQDSGDNVNVVAYDVLASAEQVAEEKGLTLAEFHESHDAGDADQVLQLACFSDVIYG